MCLSVCLCVCERERERELLNSPLSILHAYSIFCLDCRCIFCCNMESVDHLLLFCLITHSLWVSMLRLFGIDWVMPGSVVELLFSWYHWIGKYISDIWDLVPGCLMWTVWFERNWRSFEDEEKTVAQLLEFCQLTLFDWS